MAVYCFFFSFCFQNLCGLGIIYQIFRAMEKNPNLGHT